jgi:ElaB/YqjD/DUF883 family membrane-anchored ribosome-binding protein
MTQAQEAPAQGQEKMQQATGQAKSKAREQVDQRTTQAGERVSSTASDVRSVGEELRKQGKEAPARMADQVAERAERLGGYLQSSDADRILEDAEDFGRRQPWAVVAGGLVLGLAASRFLKASSRRRYRGSRGEDGGRAEIGTPYTPASAPRTGATGAAETEVEL